MNLDSLNDLPDWDDSDFSKFDEEGESWKPKPTREACKLLYKQWQEIVLMLNGVFESMNTEDQKSFSKEYWEDYKAMILGDAFQVAVKIKSSEAGELYMIRMENASIIRKNAQFIASSILVMMEENVVDKKHGEVIREEIDKFRELFKKWVSTFERDEFEDEWGLFI